MLAVTLSMLAAAACATLTYRPEKDIIQLDGKINPNIDDRASLMRLPGIGIAKAEDIIAYRKKALKANPAERPFHICEDLENVKGIGPATTNTICRWLKFD